MVGWVAVFIGWQEIKHYTNHNGRLGGSFHWLVRDQTLQPHESSACLDRAHAIVYEV